MKVLVILITMTISQAAMAIHPSGITATSEAGFSSTVSGNEDQRIMRAANDDALTFLGSEGEIRGPHLESALQRLREHHPDMTTREDAELAEFIIRSNQIHGDTTPESQQ